MAENEQGSVLCVPQIVEEAAPGTSDSEDGDNNAREMHLLAAPSQADHGDLDRASQRRRHASRDRVENEIVHYEMTPSMSEAKLKRQAWKICHDYLSGAWKRITFEEMSWKPISGGLSNYLYYCALPGAKTQRQGFDENGNAGEQLSKGSTVRDDEPREVLLRIYGQVQGEQVDVQSLLTESVIFAVLSERRLGPKLYGVFPGGRLEEYIPAPCLRSWELFDPEISGRIAEQMAKMHRLQLPLSKEPTWIWETMKKWSIAIRYDVLPLDCCPPTPALADVSPEHNEKLFQFIKEIDFEAEIRWLRRVVHAVQSPVVFGHNDLQEGNILIERKLDGSIARLAFIDFEYCSYNYRGFDLANHFCEWMYDYKVDTFPYFMNSPADYPSIDAQLHFLRNYVASWEEEAGAARMDSNVGHDYDEEALRQLLDEVDVFQLASHLFWSMWSCVNAISSNIPFGYWDYAVCRLQAYLAHKEEVLARAERGELAISTRFQMNGHTDLRCVCPC